MNIAMFYHSLISDWNHGNAHFLRGIVTELMARGHRVRVFEPRDAWSVENLITDHGEAAIAGFHRAYPDLESRRYDDSLDLDEALDGIDLVIVHEWNAHKLVARIGAHHHLNRYTLLFHDTHHRSVTAPDEMAAYDLRDYDGVLAFGGVIRDLYVHRGWTQRAWTWHEAADVRVFKPYQRGVYDGDLVWIGNWGEGERSAELHEMLLEPVRALRLTARVHGVRYPDDAKQALAAAGIHYAGWLPNYEAAPLFAKYRVTVHVPRRPYVEALPGIPTIRPFEALACGIPLVSAPWDDRERLFRTGEDYLVARDGNEMQRQLRAVIEDRGLAESLTRHGRETILARHTCAHRVDELFAIVKELT